MTNTEIKEMLAKANKMDCLERTVFFKQQKKQYKKSQFYKTTHTSLQKLYLMYCLEGLNSISRFGNSVLFTEFSKGNYAILGTVITDVIAGIDTETIKETIDELLDYIVDNIQKIDLPALQNEFKTILSNFKESLNK